MTHWMCTTCGYYLQGSAPPNRCPSCSQICVFNDITCYRPECGGEQNIDPLLVGSTLSIIKGDSEHAAQTKFSPPSSEAIPTVEILKGLSGPQKQQLRKLGHIENYDPNDVIFREGTEAKKFYLVEEGQVAVQSLVGKGVSFPISVIYPGQAFGWSALVAPYQYTATVVALTKARVIAIEQEAIQALIKADPALGLLIMQNVASIVSSRLRTLELGLLGLLRQGR